MSEVDPTAPRPPPIPTSIDVLYRDDALVVVDKPSGLSVHRGDDQGTTFALNLTRNAIGQWVYPVHRLDRATSGVLVFALSSEHARTLHESFRSRTVHKSYLAPAQKVMKKVIVRGMAHITGGGIVDNIPRILPSGTRAVIDTASWRPGPLFSFLEAQGKVDKEEMFRVFNMGIGYVFVIREKDVDTTLAILEEAKEKPILAGYITEGKQDLKLVL